MLIYVALPLKLQACAAAIANLIDLYGVCWHFYVNQPLRRNIRGPTLATHKSSHEQILGELVTCLLQSRDTLAAAEYEFQQLDISTHISLDIKDALKDIHDTLSKVHFNGLTVAVLDS